jgi:hypothetical protein
LKKYELKHGRVRETGQVMLTFIFERCYASVGVDLDNDLLLILSDRTIDEEATVTVRKATQLGAQDVIHDIVCWFASKAKRLTIPS